MSTQIWNRVESILALLAIVFSVLLFSVCDGRAKYALGEEDPGRDGYYDEETPDDWVDILFIVVIAFHHFEYAFKFTDYSLSHIHIKQHTFAAKKDKSLADLNIKTIAQKMDKLDPAKSDTSAVDVVNNVLSVFTTESDDATYRRPMHNRMCCCIRWSPRFFTWQRTYIIRTFLKFYVCISCLLAMVLYVEFFMNLFIEYLITCIVHYEDFYVFALILIPILLFVCDILIRLAWQAVIVSWSLNCDTNGELEAMNAGVGIAALRSQLVSSKRLLYTFTSDARDNYNYDIYNEEQQDIVDAEAEHRAREIEIELQAASGGNKKDTDVTEKAKEILSDTVEVVKDTAVNAVEATAEMISATKQTISDTVRSISADEDDQVQKQTTVQLDQERQRSLTKQADKAEHRARMGDYFMATCWRLGFFFYSSVAACLGAWSVEVEVAVNGFFWQLVMRYCVLGGVVWTMVYCVCALFVAVASRYRSWYLIHSHIPRYKLFFLIDAHDYETNNRAWTRMKFCIMFTSLFTFILFVALSYFFIDETWSSFLHFLGVVFALYYFINLFMACKPYALVALWMDAIPPPGKNYTAHQIASETLRDKGLITSSLKSKKNVYIGASAPPPETETKDNDEFHVEYDVEVDTQHQLSASPDDAEEKEINSEKYLKIKTPDDGTTRSDSSGDRTDTLRAMKKKKKKQMYKSFRTQRAEDIQRRYAAFTYTYIDCRGSDFPSARCCNTKFAKQKAISFLFNYEQYWLNVYRPFDEYDIESNLSSTHILHGFQWLKGMCRCRLKAVRKKSCGQKCYTVAKYLMDNFCNICVVVTTILFMIGLFQTSQRLSGNNEAFRESVIYETNNTAYYGICSDGFGDRSGNGLSQYDLSVLDITVLTQLAYEADNYDLCGVINHYFNGDFELIKINREEPFYFHIRHRYAAVDFISVRGTDNVIEMMQDLSLFVEVSIFEVLQWIVPFLNALPVSFIRQIIYYASYIEGVINADSRTAFDEPVIEYAKAYLHRLESNCSYNSSTIANWNGPTTLYFVGHSLGGAIGEIVGANLHEYGARNGLKSHIQSYGVCSPGVLLSSAKFGFGVEALDKTSSSLLPRRDMLSMVDSHGGSIQFTECEASSMMQCHVMDNVLCELFYGCPSDLAGPKQQWFVDFCETSKLGDDNNKAQIGKSMLNDGVNIAEISDWDFEDILDKCDDLVYEECAENEQQINEQCWIDFGDKDICHSEAQIHIDY